MRINLEQLKEIAPHCRYPHEWVKPLNDAMQRGEINTVKRMAAFLGQLIHESASLNRVEENLNYSPQRLLQVWPSRFVNLEAALSCGRNPERLANRVYADRMGNGPPECGDGYRYRGRGLIQLTGKENYERMAKLMDMPSLVEHPDKLLVPRFAALSAAMYWKDNKLNDVADKITATSLPARVKTLTKRVNGGTHGLEERLELTERAIAMLDTEFAI